MIHRELWNILAGMNPADVSRRSLAHYDQALKGYRLRILSRDYNIYPGDQIIQDVDSLTPQPPNFYLQLTAVNYLIGAQEIPCAGRWMSERQFPGGPLFFRGPHEMPVRRLQETFGQDLSSFRDACFSCGGKRVDGGDITFELPVLPRLPVRIILWKEDEEFSARICFLFDQTADKHLRLDALWSVGKAIEKALLQKIELC